MKFDHLEEKWLQDLLENNWDGDEDTVCQALTYSRDCVEQDVHNELLDFRIVEARADALEQAEIAWNELGDGFAAVEELQKLWNI